MRDWLDRLSHTLVASQKQVDDARRRVATQLVRGVLVARDAGSPNERKATASVRANQRQRVYYQVRVTVQILEGETHVPCWQCSCSQHGCGPKFSAAQHTATCASARLTRPRNQVCVHTLAVVLAVQALEEEWSAFPTHWPNPNTQIKKLGGMSKRRQRQRRPLNVMRKFFKTFTWADVMRSLREDRFKYQPAGLAYPPAAACRAMPFPAENDPDVPGAAKRRRRGRGIVGPDGRGVAARRAAAARPAAVAAGPADADDANGTSISAQPSVSSRHVDASRTDDADGSHAHVAHHGGTDGEPPRLRAQDFDDVVRNAQAHPNAGRASRPRRLPMRLRD